MLKDFLDRDLLLFDTVDGDNWQEAIRKSCLKLTENGYVESKYADEIIECVGKYGPYIVIIPEVAMPHSSENSPYVKGTAISLTIFDSSVNFDEEKNARLFFTLAAKNPEEHTNNIATLSELLMTDGLVDDLLTVTNLDEYRVVMDKYTE